MHAHGSISERDSCRTQITPHFTAQTPKLAYRIYKHSAFLRHKVIHALPNATVL